jgi:hypothetical protein
VADPQARNRLTLRHPAATGFTGEVRREERRPVLLTGGVHFAAGPGTRISSRISPAGSVGPDRRLEDVLDTRLKEPGDAESEAKAGVVLPPFEGIHGLTRNLELFREVGLRPLPLGAEILQSICHQDSRR